MAEKSERNEEKRIKDQRKKRLKEFLIETSFLRINEAGAKCNRRRKKRKKSEARFVLKKENSTVLRTDFPHNLRQEGGQFFSNENPPVIYYFVVMGAARDFLQ